MRLRVAAAGLVPFLLVALYWQHASSSAAGSDRALVRQQVQRTAVVAAEAAAVAAAAKSSAAAAHATAAPPSASTVATKDTPAPKPGAAAAAATPAVVAHIVAPTAEARDVALDWGPPTLSSKRIIDGSPNYLPVPNAEGPAPDDMAWRKEVSSDPSVPCPAGRRPYHTILTAQGSLYQQWQTKIFYYHFRKQQAAGGRCTEMTGFTRLLAGKPDELMPTIPTVAVPEARRRTHTPSRSDEPSEGTALSCIQPYSAVYAVSVPPVSTPTLLSALHDTVSTPRPCVCGVGARGWAQRHARVPGHQPAVEHAPLHRHEGV